MTPLSNTYAFLIQISIASSNTLALNLDVYCALDGPSPRCFSCNSSPLSTCSSINSLYVVDCGIRFFTKKCMDLIHLWIMTGFYFFCSSDCLAGPAHCLSMTFCCSTCLGILAVMDESWCHLHPLRCFSSSVEWFQSTTPLVVYPHFALEMVFPTSYHEYKPCQV